MASLAGRKRPRAEDIRAFLQPSLNSRKRPVKPSSSFCAISNVASTDAVVFRRTDSWSMRTEAGSHSSRAREAYAVATALTKWSESTTPAPAGTAQPTFLTKDGASWYVLFRGFMPPRDRAAFEDEWALHPDTFHSLRLYGKTVHETRWSQIWGRPYRYSGAVALPRNISESTMLTRLLRDVNHIWREAREIAAVEQSEEME